LEVAEKGWWELWPAGAKGPPLPVEAGWQEARLEAASGAAGAAVIALPEAKAAATAESCSVG